MVLQTKIPKPRRIKRADGGYMNSYPEGLIGAGNYLDTGCTLPGGRVLPSCLSCPLPVCKLDVLNEERDRGVVEMRKSGMGVPYTAKYFKISPRTVSRITSAAGAL